VETKTPLIRLYNGKKPVWIRAIWRIFSSSLYNPAYNGLSKEKAIRLNIRRMASVPFVDTLIPEDASSERTAQDNSRFAFLNQTGVGYFSNPRSLSSDLAGLERPSGLA
jgi:hypothetical protein